MRVWSKRSLENMEGIHPDLRVVMDEALQLSETDFTVIEGMRTLERQKWLLKKGYSKTLNSRHLTGHAVDVVPYPITKHLVYPHDKWLELSRGIKLAAHRHGVPIEWGYDEWGWDKPHWQLPWAVYPKEA